MRMRDRPDCALVKSIGRFELNPVGHRVSNVVVSPTRSFATGSGNDCAAIRPKPICVRTLLLDLGEYAERAGWRGCTLLSDCGRRYQERPVALHDVDHFALKRHLYADGTWIVRFVSNHFVRFLRRRRKYATPG